MKKNILIFSIICAAFLFAACTKNTPTPFDPQENTPPALPVIRKAEEGVTPPEEISSPPAVIMSPFASTFYESDDEKGFVLRMQDIGQGSSIKLVEASKAYDEYEQFHLKIEFEDGQVIEDVIQMSLLQEDYFQCTDVTGDGYPEIVFADLGGENSLGLTAPLILKIENGGIVKIPLFTIDEGVENFKVINSKTTEKTITIVSKQTGLEYAFDVIPLCEHRNMRLDELQFIASTAGVYACDLWPITETQFGLTWKSFIELRFEENESSNPDAKIVTTAISKAVYDEGRWVITETLQEPEYQ